MIKDAIKKVVAGLDLAEEESVTVMEQIMSGEATPAQIASFLTALSLKGETVEEVIGFARVMRRKVTPVRSSYPLVVDTCGTGGDGAGTFNISTAAALVVAGAGVPVAKHGNRSVSSRCGSADVLEALGVRIELTPEEAAGCLDRVGIAFLFAPLLHGAMKHAAGPRREIGIRTVFNILGPMTNPAGAGAQVLGVYEPRLTRLLADALARLGTEHAFVVHGAGGLDEVSLAGPAVLCEVSAGSVRDSQLDPAEYGFDYFPVSALAGGTAGENAAIIRSVLAGERGPQRDAVILNAALGLVAGQKASGVAEGIAMAGESIDSGAAMGRLEALVSFTR